MKNISLKQYLWIFIAFVFLLAGSNANGQANKKKVATIALTAKVFDEDGNPLENAVITTDQGDNKAYSGADGTFTIPSKQNGAVLIELDGYKPLVWNLKTQGILAKAVLSKTLLFTEEKDQTQGILAKAVLSKTLLFTEEKDQRSLPMLVTESTRNLVGAATRIEGADLETYNGLKLSKALQGRAMGLMVENSSGGLTNGASLYVRGKSSNSYNAALVIVDGIERDLDDILPEEIESIEVIKDATAKILYGPRAASGVVLVKTKTGKAYQRKRKFSAEFGIGLPTRLPDFIDAYDYATLYNEARENDGLAPIYDDDDLEAYQNSAGNNDILHPDVDYYDYFLNEFTTNSRYTAEFSGGNEGAKYAVVGGYAMNKGLQDVGVSTTYNRFNLRGNLDIKVTDRISATAGMAFNMYKYNRGELYDSGIFSALSNHRPNEYPLTISEDYIAKTADGVPALGASSTYAANLLGSMKYSGDVETNYYQNSMTMGLNYDLSYLTEGLKASGFVTFDNFFYATEELDITPATYKPYATTAADGSDSIAFVTMQKASDNDSYELTSDYTTRTYGYTFQLNYDKQFGLVDFSSTMGYFYYYDVVNGSSTDITTDNTYLRTNYSINNKYIFEANLALMGSSKFSDDNRHFLSYALGGAWILSDEAFMQQYASVDFLKLKTAGTITEPQVLAIQTVPR